MGVHTHTLQPHTQRDLQSRFGREKTHQQVKLQQIVKTNHKRYSSQHLLKETMKKRSTLASNTSSSNDCLCLTCIIITKLINDSVCVDDIIPPGRGSWVLSYINLDITLNQCKDYESRTSRHKAHPPLQLPRNTPEKKKGTHFVNWAVPQAALSWF